MLALPSQLPGTSERWGLTREELDRAAWTIDRGGRRLGGAAAVNRTLQTLGGPWRAVAFLYRLPGVARLEERAYRWVATHRHAFRRLAVTPECERSDVKCE